MFDFRGNVFETLIGISIGFLLFTVIYTDTFQTKIFIDKTIESLYDNH